MAPDGMERDIEIAGLTCDSRRVAPGFLFAALPGAHADGRAFIPRALEQGAAAILAPPGTRLEDPDAAPLIVDDNPRRRYALMAARFFKWQPETVAAVTGTNGKTSVAGFLRQIWGRLGHRAASLGTLGVTAPGFSLPGGLTTPDPADLHATLARLYLDGVDHLAIEASSHGLEQFRLDGVRIQAAGFTNLSRDHLDYHPDMEAYLAAKRRLFAELLPADGTAVLNADTPQAAGLRAVCEGRGIRVLDYGTAARDLRLTELRPQADGQRLTLELQGRTLSVDLPLLGRFQVENALCALGLAVALGAGTEAAETLAHLQGAPGRLQRVATHPVHGAPAIVDYAHTPDALASVLTALRPHASGRLLVVFGCGGDRDPGKRPEMGHIVHELAEVAIVTDDNPRSEDPAEIRRQILTACPTADEIGDRAEAIREAVRRLQPGDVLLVAGKGHETGQIRGDVTLPFDDAGEVRRAMRETGS